jgi:hypothetical protein
LEHQRRRGAARADQSRGPRHHHRRAGVLAFVVVALIPARAAAEVDDYEPEKSCRAGPARFELAPWLSLGGGARWDADGRRHAIGSLAIDGAVTVPLEKWFRAGAWVQPGTTDFRSFDAAGGVRLELQSNELNSEPSKLFRVGGRTTVLLDLGAGYRFPEGGFYTAKLAFGFTAPNLLGFYPRPSCPCGPNDPPRCYPDLGMIAGVRPWISFNRSFESSRTDLTGGLSFEVIGAAWWMLGGT